MNHLNKSVSKIIHSRFRFATRMTAFKQGVFFSLSLVLFTFILCALFYTQTPRSDSTKSSNKCIRVYYGETSCFQNKGQDLKPDFFKEISKAFKIIEKKPYCDDELFGPEGNWKILNVSNCLCIKHFFYTFQFSSQRTER